MGKPSFFLLVSVPFLAILSCAPQSSTARPEQPLVLAIHLDQDKVSSFDEFYGDLILKNVGDKDLLVNARLASVPYPWPPEIIEGVTRITNQLGDAVNPRSKIDIQFPKAEMFVILKPGQEIRKFITLSRLGYNSNLFVLGEKYTLVAIYQNELDVEIEVEGKTVSSWIGSIQSIPLTFEFAQQ